MKQTCEPELGQLFRQHTRLLKLYGGGNQGIYIYITEVNLFL